MSKRQLDSRAPGDCPLSLRVSSNLKCIYLNAWSSALTIFQPHLAQLTFYIFRIEYGLIVTIHMYNEISKIFCISLCYFFPSAHCVSCQYMRIQHMHYFYQLFWWHQETLVVQAYVVASHCLCVCIYAVYFFLLTINFYSLYQ